MPTFQRSAPPNPVIDRSVARPIVGTVADITGRLDELLDAAKLSSQWDNRLVDELPEAGVWSLFEFASRRHDCPEIGLLAGERLLVSDLGPFSLQLRNSLTLYHCLNNYIRTVSQYSSHARFWLAHEADSLWFCRQGIDLISMGRDQVEQFTVQLMIRLVQLSAGSEWMPPKIRIQAGSDKAFRQSTLFDEAEIESRQSATAIQIPRLPGLVLLPMATEEPDLVQRIREALIQMARTSRLDIDKMAGELGVSRRTLQRKLAACGVDWSQLVEQCRFGEAVRHLTESSIPLLQLTQQLGYTDQANFGRAFRKWTGISPASFRRSVASQEQRSFGTTKP